MNNLYVLNNSNKVIDSLDSSTRRGGIMAVTAKFNNFLGFTSASIEISKKSKLTIYLGNKVMVYGKDRKNPLFSGVVTDIKYPQSTSNTIKVTVKNRLNELIKESVDFTIKEGTTIKAAFDNIFNRTGFRIRWAANHILNTVSLATDYTCENKKIKDSLQELCHIANSLTNDNFDFTILFDGRNGIVFNQQKTVETLFQNYDFISGEYSEDKPEFNHIKAYKEDENGDNVFLFNLEDPFSIGEVGLLKKEVFFGPKVNNDTTKVIAQQMLNGATKKNTSVELKKFIKKENLAFGTYEIRTAKVNDKEEVTLVTSADKWDKTNIRRARVTTDFKNFQSGSSSLQIACFNGCAGERLYYELEDPIGTDGITLVYKMVSGAKMTVIVYDTLGNQQTMNLIPSEIWREATIKISTSSKTFILGSRLRDKKVKYRAVKSLAGGDPCLIKVSKGNNLINIAKVGIDIRTNYGGLYIDKMVYYANISRRLRSKLLSYKIKNNWQGSFYVSSSDLGRHKRTSLDDLKETVKNADITYTNLNRGG